MTILILVLIVGVLYYLLKPPSIGNIATATPHFPIVGNAIAYGKDPLKFLAKQRARYGDVFLVNLGILRAVFFLGPQGTTAILKGTERSGLSFYQPLDFFFPGTNIKGIIQKNPC